MDIGTAFLLGVLVGQWVLLFIIWRAVTRLLKIVTENGEQISDSASPKTMIVQLDDDRERYPKF